MRQWRLLFFFNFDNTICLSNFEQNLFNFYLCLVLIKFQWLKLLFGLCLFWEIFWLIDYLCFIHGLNEGFHLLHSFKIGEFFRWFFRVIIKNWINFRMRIKHWWVRLSRMGMNLTFIHIFVIWSVWLLISFLMWYLRECEMIKRRWWWGLCFM